MAVTWKDLKEKIVRFFICERPLTTIFNWKAKFIMIMILQILNNGQMKITLELIIYSKSMEILMNKINKSSNNINKDGAIQIIIIIT